MELKAFRMSIETRQSTPNVRARRVLNQGWRGWYEKLKAGAACNANLNRPRGTAWLVRGRG